MDRPWVFQEYEVPRFQDNRHMKVARLSALRTGCLYPPVNIPDTRVKRDQLDVTCFIISSLNAQHVSDVNTSILRSLRLICWVISWVVLIWFDVCWCYVVVWLGWCGIRMQAEAVLQPCFIISFNAQHVSDVNTSILRSLRHICWVISCAVLL